VQRSWHCAEICKASQSSAADIRCLWVVRLVTLATSLFGLRASPKDQMRQFWAVTSTLSSESRILTYLIHSHSIRSIYENLVTTVMTVLELGNVLGRFHHLLVRRRLAESITTSDRIAHNNGHDNYSGYDPNRNLRTL